MEPFKAGPPGHGIVFKKFVRCPGFPNFLVLAQTV